MRFSLAEAQPLLQSSTLLPPQHFSGNPLDRTYDKRRKFDGTSKQEEVRGQGAAVGMAAAGMAAAGLLAKSFGVQRVHS